MAFIHHYPFSPMAVCLLLVLFAFQAAEAQQRYSNISLGKSLTPGTSNSSWFSPSGLYAFGFFKQAYGFAVGIFVAGIPEKTVVWTANYEKNSTVPDNATLLLTTDGRLILQQQSDGGQEIPIASPSQAIARASMLDTGNFVLYGSDGTIVWESFDHPTDTLLPGQRLSEGQQLYSRASDADYSKGIFGLYMQNDGNLVQYPVEGIASQNAYFATMTFGINITLNLDDDGRLYLLNGTFFNIRNLTGGGFPKGRTTILYRVTLDVDGIFRVYSHSSDKGNWTQEWSPTNDRCVPKGLCGVNGFCVLIDQTPDCRCLPGFEFIDPGNRRSGCQSNFTTQSCKGKYEISMSQSIIWEDNAYAVLETSRLEDCQAACQQDCNCEAAIFGGGECRKQKLPLRYGRRSVSNSDTTLIKVATPKTVTNETLAHQVSEEKEKKQHVGVLIVGISLTVFAVLTLATSGILARRARIWGYKTIREMRNVELLDDVAPRSFTYAELLQLTNDFKDELGSGAFGRVYKGVLTGTRKAVAVKRLEKLLEEGEREFQTEMKVIGKTHHKNLVRLLGYCIDGPKRLLVYEFMPNGSLADILFTPDNQLSWEERIQIALDIARGIHYLHEECETQIIHCDIKPQNILMDENMSAKISDFGLAKLLKHDQTKTYTAIRGTRGYVAPEWHRRLPVTVKADVYSFGIVMFEIICRRKSVDWSLDESEAVLEIWAFECFEAGKLGELVCDEEVDVERLDRLVKVGIWCIQDEPSLRPSMKKVLLMLEGTVDVPVPPSPSSFFSTI